MRICVRINLPSPTQLRPLEMHRVERDFLLTLPPPLRRFLHQQSAREGIATMKASKSMRVWFAFYGAIIWLGIFLIKCKSNLS